MKTEYEARILEIKREDFIKELEEVGATKVGDYNQRRYVYDFKPVLAGKWIRLRDNGVKSTLTIKNINNDNIDGTQELEIEVSDFEQTNMILNELGYEARSYQENKRTRYMYKKVEIDIDTWPMIPTYVEFEGDNKEQILEVIEELGFRKEDIITYGVSKIYSHYGINIDDYKILKF